MQDASAVQSALRSGPGLKPAAFVSETSLGAPRTDARLHKRMHAHTNTHTPGDRFMHAHEFALTNVHTQVREEKVQKQADCTVWPGAVGISERQAEVKVKTG